METKDYSILVEKLAEEIIGEALIEKEAGIADKAKIVAEEAAAKGKGAASVVAGKAKAAVNAGKEVASQAPDKAKSAVDKARGFAQAHKAALGVGAGAGAAGYVAGRVDGANKEAEEENYEIEKTAEEQAIAILEKASAVYEDAQFMKQAALEVLAEAEMYEDAAARIFEDMGLMDEE